MAVGSALVYGLSFAASAVCAWLLLRACVKSGAKLLLWSGICFVMLALNNLLVIVDIFVVPATDLTDLRVLASFVGIALLIYGFIWEID